MSKRNRFSKANRAKFFHSMCDLMESLDGIKVTSSDYPLAEYRIDTRYGGLKVTIYETWVATRFDNRPDTPGGTNGKWNHDWFHDESVSNAISGISEKIRRIAVMGPDAIDRIKQAIERDTIEQRRWNDAMQDFIHSQQPAT